MTRKIGPRKGRHSPGREEDDVEATLASARQIFADVSSFLEREIDRLKTRQTDDPDRLRAVMDLIKQNQQALLRVLEMRAKLGREARAECSQMLDLESARAEIDRRLARLTE